MAAEVRRILTALEHDTIPITPQGAGFSLTPAEAERLARIGELRPGFCQRGHLHLKLAQYCGVVNLGGRVLEVLPKTQDRQMPAEACRGVLLRLLRLSGRFPHFRHLPTGHHLRRVPLLEAFIAVFFEAVGGVVRGGLLRQYLEHEDDLGLVRGRIATARQLGAQANRKDVVACVFDELSTDNVWNRVLKKALRATRPWLHAPELGRRWIELMGMLDPVDDALLTCAEIDRRAQRYRDAIGWARWILALLAPALRAGTDDAPALLFDMNKLFESSIAGMLRKAVPLHTLEIITQHDGLFLATVISTGKAEPGFMLRPDLLLRQSGHVVVVADTKWKHIDRDRRGRPCPAEADMYQMHAYASAFRCHDLALIYPWDEFTAMTHTVFRLPETTQGGAATVHVLGVDVGDDALPLRLGEGPLALTRLFASR